MELFNDTKKSSRLNSAGKHGTASTFSGQLPEKTDRFPSFSPRPPPKDGNSSIFSVIILKRWTPAIFSFCCAQKMEALPTLRADFPKTWRHFHLSISRSPKDGRASCSSNRLHENMETFPSFHFVLAKRWTRFLLFEATTRS